MKDQGVLPGQRLGGFDSRRVHTRVWLHRCPECGLYMRVVSRFTGERYLECIDRFCGYQEVA